MKWAVEALQYYLLGNPFQLITDQAPPSLAQFNERHQCPDLEMVSLPLAIQLSSIPPPGEGAG